MDTTWILSPLPVLNVPSTVPNAAQLQVAPSALMDTISQSSHVSPVLNIAASALHLLSVHSVRMDTIWPVMVRLVLPVQQTV